MQTSRRVLTVVLLLLTACIAPATGIGARPPVPKPVAFETYNSYVVSSKFEPDAARSFLVIQDQKTFDEVFDTATGDDLHRLPANLFDKQIVLVAIRRGKAGWQFNAPQVSRAGRMLWVRYAGQQTKSNSTGDVGPLIISVPKGADGYVEFIENGRLVKSIELVPPPATPLRSVAGWIGEHDDPQSPALALLGHRGVLFIRSEARWEEWRRRLAPAGPLVHEFNIDFAKQSAVVFYKGGPAPMSGCDLDLGDLSAQPPWLHLQHTSDFYGDHIAPHYVNYVLIAIPATTPAFKLMGGDRDALEFSVVLDAQEGGDIVDNLQAVIAPKRPTIKPGEDIEIDMTLRCVANAPAPAGAAAPHAAVWDAVYSEGYRNYGFFVTGPDGKTTLLRPAEMKDWKKNAPHVVDITAANPYHLSDDRRLSLKVLGLDTTTPGSYTITGLYEETAGKARDPVLWAGSIASNSVTVRVQD